ncbi:MAG: carbohydate-binding domain-containing protein [Dysgonamonadaceae bacterium]|jgi:hexosaminidase|nr:carbohydate-binding domain-containing protein [Dysgonamonadaceae bacterium]
MKKTSILSICLVLLAGCTTNKQTGVSLSLTWEMGQNGIQPGVCEQTFYIKNTGKTELKNNWTIYFNQISTASSLPDENAVLVIERIASTYFKMYPVQNYKPLAPGETLTFTYRCRGGIIKESAAPQGAYIVCTDKNGREQQPQNIPIEVLPFTHAYQWTRPGTAELPYPDGNYMYAQNAFFNEKVELDEYAIFPSLKSLKKTGGTSSFSQSVQLKYDVVFENEAALLQEQLVSQFGCTVSETGETLVELKHPAAEGNYKKGYYELTVGDNRVEICGMENEAVFYACQTLINVLGNAGKLPATLSNVHITDYPDTHHRGIMLDVARNFTKKEDVLKIIDRLALYKLNVLHWHLTDDEAWRLEIPGLEELTAIASRRGHTHDESTCLYPAFAWGWDASDETSPANGYYTRSDFIEVLKYAGRRHIRVIPEVDIPGHSRAAIKAMNARYKKYINTDKQKAEEYLLADFADTSKYNSAQNFTDNVLNVALPSSYRFVEKVVDEIDKMYDEAGLKLTVFHIGGDEVPKGAWEGSAVCRDLMKARDMKEIRELKDYFLEQVLPVLSKRDIQPAGWEEVAMHDGTPNPKFANSNILSYCWRTLPDQLPYKLANAGYPVILCNVTNLYMDMSYSRHQSEPGLHWGGFVDEYNSFDLLPYDIYKSVHNDLNGEPLDINAISKGKVPLDKGASVQIKGLQAQLWAETIRNFEQVEYLYFPKLFGLIERAWNIQPEWSNPYNERKYETAKRVYNARIAEKELPRLAKSGVNFRVSQPGIIIKDNLLYANSAIPGAVIRYTIDGSEPAETSTVWINPVACNAGVVKAKAFYLGKESVTTLLKR